MIKAGLITQSTLLLASYLFQSAAVAQATTIKVNPLRDAYYGDLHLHTSYSLDAYFAGTDVVDPEKAYRFARGDAVGYLHQSIRRREPLDFMAVTDHAEYLGIFTNLDDPKSAVSQSDAGREVNAWIRAGKSTSDFPSSLSEMFKDWGHPRKEPLPEALKDASMSAWQREVGIANREYEPGKFTTFIAYEWTAGVGDGGLHRNVIFRGNSAPYPFSSLDSNRPEDLWAWLNTIRKEGYEALAIPHNGNVSNGLMYDWVKSDGKPIDDLYAQERQSNEPLSEIAQTKGQSDVYPLLAPSDEFANFEVMETWDGKPVANYKAAGSYLRDAFGRGLVLERELGVNPFKYGVVGASDIHTGLSVSSQQDWDGSFWRADLGARKLDKKEAAEILNRSTIVLDGPGTTAGALTGAWAESNTRESIYDALRRRETFATSGSRLKFRFFGGWNFDQDLLQRKDWIATAYAKGVPMGGDLAPRLVAAQVPTFAIWAVKDPNGANLDRVQVIKVWEQDGKQKERVFDVVWSGTRQPDGKTGKLPAVGNTVNLKAGTYVNNIGAVELETLWKDPEFDPKRFAAYYLRVLEIPTPRWSTLVAAKNSLPLPMSVPATEQQRGWSSPIWYTPHGM